MAQSAFGVQSVLSKSAKKTRTVIDSEGDATERLKIGKQVGFSNTAREARRKFLDAAQISRSHLKPHSDKPGV
jgi:hypothetical protein